MLYLSESRDPGRNLSLCFCWTGHSHNRLYADLSTSVKNVKQELLYLRCIKEDLSVLYLSESRNSESCYCRETSAYTFSGQDIHITEFMQIYLLWSNTWNRNHYYSWNQPLVAIIVMQSKQRILLLKFQSMYLQDRTEQCRPALFKYLKQESFLNKRSIQWSMKIFKNFFMESTSDKIVKTFDSGVPFKLQITFFQESKFI